MKQYLMVWPLALIVSVAIVTSSDAAVTLNYTNNLVLWLKADAGVTVDGSGTNVVAWADQSGNGFVADQTPLTSYLQPDLVPNAVNGNPALHFDGANDHLAITNQTLNLTSGLSIFILARNNVRKNYNGLFKIYTGPFPYSPNSALEIYWQAGTTDNGSGNIYYVANRDTYPTPYGDIGGFDQPPAVGNPYLYDVVATTGTGAQRVNGATAGSPSGNTFVPTVADNVAIGYGFSGYPVDGQIAEIVVYNTALTSQQRDYVWSYLEGKYSLGIPEPSTLAFLGLGAMLVVWSRRR